MFALFRDTMSRTPAQPRKLTVRPCLEGLEDRLLLYSTLGGHFVYGSRITYSFMPDGTNVGGTPSALYQTLNAKFSTATWQLQFQKAAALWQAYANVNLSEVSDDGSPEACNGNQQGDSRFGDIRIGMIDMGGGVLGGTVLPPPINGGTEAGDIFINSSANWRINTDYDLETVAIHEFGHALGLGESQITTACMYAYYNGMKQKLTTDDVAGIQAVWGAGAGDQFNSGGRNNGNYVYAANISSYIDANSQIAIPSLRLNSGSQAEWFSVTVPASTTGTMVVKVQSSNLSILSPKLSVYSTGLSLLGTATSTAYGDTVTVSLAGVRSGQTYLIRANGNTATSPTGGFGLELNFGSAYQAPISPPYTVVPQQPDQGGGSANVSVRVVRIGALASPAAVLMVNPSSGPGILGLMTTKITAAPSNSMIGALLAFMTQDQAFESSSEAAVIDNGTSDEASMVLLPALAPSTYQAIDSILCSFGAKSLLSPLTEVNVPGSLLSE